MHENTKCSQLICSGEYRKLNLRHRLIGYKKDIKNSEMGFWCLFCVLEIFSKNEEKEDLLIRIKKPDALGTRITDIFCIFYRRKAFISFLFYVLISAEISVSAYP